MSRTCVVRACRSAESDRVQLLGVSRVVCRVRGARCQLRRRVSSRRASSSCSESVDSRVVCVVVPHLGARYQSRRCSRALGVSRVVRSGRVVCHLIVCRLVVRRMAPSLSRFALCVASVSVEQSVASCSCSASVAWCAESCRISVHDVSLVVRSASVASCGLAAS